MSFLQTFNGYVKGNEKVIYLKNLSNIEESKLRNDKVDKEDSDMFSKMYWFGNEDSEVVKDPWLPSLSNTQRIVGFFMFLMLGLFCFIVAGLTAPILVLKLRKFILLYTMGSVFTMGSFAVLWGPCNHFKHIFSYGRLPFTCAYFGSLSATLYSAMVLRSTTVTIIFASLQMVSLAWYVCSYIPGGATGLRFFSKLFASACAKSIDKSLPI